MATMLFELVAEMEDGQTHQVVADQRDIAKWEAQPFGCSFAEYESRAMGFLRFLAWSALDRRSVIDLKWTEFDATCIEVVPVADEESELPADAEDPGQSAP